MEFEARGASLAAAFENAAAAMFASMTDLSRVRPARAVRISIHRRTDDCSLLYDFLDKLIYLMDSRGMFFSKFSVRIAGDRLLAAAHGEVIRPEHPRFALVKAVTYHDMAIWRLPGGDWACRVVIDI